MKIKNYVKLTSAEYEEVVTNREQVKALVRVLAAVEARGGDEIPTELIRNILGLPERRKQNDGHTLEIPNFVNARAARRA